MKRLANLVLTPLLPAMLMCLLASNNVVADNYCGSGTVKKLTFNESDTFDFINKVNNIRFTLSDNSEYWINNDGGLAGNTIFGSLERAVTNAYFNNINIMIVKRKSFDSCTGRNSQNELLVLYPNNPL